jgi:ribosomal protein L11 methyltransferase
LNWIEITAELAEAPADWSLLISLFEEFGSPNTLQTDDPPTLVGSIVEAPGSEETVSKLRSELLEAGAQAVKTRVGAEEDWMDAFRKHFSARRIGKRLVIVPTWEKYQSEPEDLIITLDPGQAFGTGDHPTTRMCLELLEGAALAGKRVLDLGCGTGILSIAAVKLGAGEVLAIDIEPMSVEVSKENARKNQVAFEARVGSNVADAGVGWDVVVSNIISATLISLAPAISEIVLPGGQWIVSGIIHDNWPDVRAAAARAGFELDRQLGDEQWTAAIFIRKCAI